MDSSESHADIRKIAAQQSVVVVPARIWAWIGAALLAFELYVLGAWLSGPLSVPTNPGTDLLPDSTRIAGIVAQTVAVIAGAAFMYVFVLRRRLKSGRFDTIALLAVCWALMWFWDPMMNYTSPHLLYNSYLVNLGSWTLGATPGWTSPNGNLLPEPLLIVIPGYPVLCLGSAILANWFLQKFAPRMSKAKMIAATLLLLFVADIAIEVTLIRTGLYVFPGGIRSITLFAGQSVGFPLTEALFCSLTWTSTFLLLIYRDDKGMSFVERGAERLAKNSATKTLIRFLAILGFTHLATVVLWVVPNQWLGSHSGPYPDGLPSYLINNMCVYGPNQNQCPGPGISIVRP